MYSILFLPLLSALRDSFRRRAALQLELIAVRHQLATMKRTSRRPSLRPTDRLLWVLLSRLLPNWREMLVIVKPETVIGWHRKGFRLYWTWKSRQRRGGRPPIPRDVRALISRMSRENPLWGAPRIHGELLKLGIEVSEAMRRLSRRSISSSCRLPRSGFSWSSSFCTTNADRSSTSA